MAYKFCFTDDHGLFTCYSGKLTNDEALECLMNKVQDPRFASVKYVVNDFSDVTEFLLTQGGLRELSQVNIEYSKVNPSLIAVAINPTVLGHGYIRMWQAYTPDDDTGWTTISVANWDDATDCIKTLLNILIEKPDY